MDDLELRIRDASRAEVGEAPSLVELEKRTRRRQMRTVGVIAAASVMLVGVLIGSKLLSDAPLDVGTADDSGPPASTFEDGPSSTVVGSDGTIVHRVDDPGANSQFEVTLPDGQQILLDLSRLEGDQIFHLEPGFTVNAGPNEYTTLHFLPGSVADNFPNATQVTQRRDVGGRVVTEIEESGRGRQLVFATDGWVTTVDMQGGGISSLGAEAIVSSLSVTEDDHGFPIVETRGALRASPPYQRVPTMTLTGWGMRITLRVTRCDQPSPIVAAASGIASICLGPDVLAEATFPPDSVQPETLLQIQATLIP